MGVATGDGSEGVHGRVVVMFAIGWGWLVIANLPCFWFWVWPAFTCARQLWHLPIVPGALCVAPATALG